MKTGDWGVYDHSWSSAMSLFTQAHMASYLSTTLTMCRFKT